MKIRENTIYLRNRSWLLLCLLVFTSACQKQDSSLIQKQYFIFGTIIEVLVWHDDEVQVNKAFLEVEAELNGMHSQWHAWKAGKLNIPNSAGLSLSIFNIST